MPVVKGNILILSEELKRGFDEEIKAFRHYMPNVVTLIPASGMTRGNPVNLLKIQIQIEVLAIGYNTNLTLSTN